MNRKHILQMLSEIVEELDYDIWKQLFVPECMEDPEEAKEQIARLVEIAKKHLSERGK